MKANLMYRDRDFDLKTPLPWGAEALTQDLGLTTIFAAMGGEDKFLREVAEKGVLASLFEVQDIAYRQDIMRDCFRNPDTVRKIYDFAFDTLENERKNFWRWGSFPSSVLSGAVSVLNMFVERLKILRQIASDERGNFRSEGFGNLFSMLLRELDDDYFAEITAHLKQLKFSKGVRLSAELGPGNMGINYLLRRDDKPLSWKEWIFGPKPEAYSFTLHPRDENGARALTEMEDRGINLVANALAQSTDHISNFFKMLRTELAFYIGCINLRDALQQNGESFAFPVLSGKNERKFSCTGLYDACLSLNMNKEVVGNDIEADGDSLIIVTGANQGGKSTFLRSVGLAQVMTQCGMFVPASALSLNICDGIFTHFKREEDTAMASGKFDEELKRMSELVERLKPNTFVLFNESFAATNELEGSEIAGQITTALIEKDIKVCFVTHLHEFAEALYERKMDAALFLRAERLEDGSRTFKLRPGKPLSTSFGVDLYNRIFEKNLKQPSSDRGSGSSRTSVPELH